MKFAFLIFCLAMTTSFAIDELEQELNQAQEDEFSVEPVTTEINDSISEINSDLPQDISVEESSSPNESNNLEIESQAQSNSLDDNFFEEDQAQASEESTNPTAPIEVESFSEIESETENEPLSTPPPIIVEEPIQSEEENTFVQEEPIQSIQENESEALYSEESTNTNFVESSEFEQKLRRIYEKFYSSPIGDQEWIQIAGEQINESYSIQQGDTLWDISVTFFGNGHYWPKVWQLNDEITNPHKIEPGTLLKFSPGTLESAPQLNMAEAETLAEPVVPLAEAPKPVIPPPSKKSVPVVKNIPPSFPFLVSKKYEEYDNDGFSKAIPKVSLKNTPVYHQSYISMKEPTSYGTIVEMDKDDADTASVFDTLFVKANQNLQVGSTYFVYSLGDTLKSGSKKGVQIISRAEIRIMNPINESESIYKAIVTKALGPVKISDNFTFGEIPKSFLEGGIQGTSTAKVIGGDYFDERKKMAQYNIIYLDQGQSSGVQKGQIYSVVKNQRERNKIKAVDNLNQEIAKVKILESSDGFATAVVLNSSEDIRPGDYIGVRNSDSNPVNPSEESDLDSFIED